jgi:hypothetical protein
MLGDGGNGFDNLGVRKMKRNGESFNAVQRRETLQSSGQDVPLVRQASEGSWNGARTSVETVAA